MLVQKLLKPCEKIGESYNIECYNCSYEKPRWRKLRNKHYLYVDIASLKPVVRKLLKQNSHREKSIIRSLNVRWLYDKALAKSCKSLSRRIPIPATHLENVAYGRDLVNKLAKLWHDLICRILISPLTCSSCG
jgi:hypothetical protein